MTRPLATVTEFSGAPKNNATTPVAHFDITYRHLLDAEGHPVGDLPDFAHDRDTVKALYEAMMLTRAFDKRAVALQRTGQLGTFPSSLGQESVPVGVAAAMTREDVLLGTYREQGAMFWRGVSPEELLQFWGGDERGCVNGGPEHDFPPSIPVASHAPQAAGVAMAMKIRRKQRAAVCILGDGATSKGDFYEAVNAAGTWRLPVLFVVINNGWAISVPRSRQTAAETIAQKAIAGGIPGEQIDGNDVLIVRQAAAEALDRARAGMGATLIEALTYRLSDHTTADDATRYRSDDEVSRHWKADPLLRLRTYMADRGWWSKENEEALSHACHERIEAAKEAYLALESDRPSAMFDHLFETLPAPLLRQRRRMASQQEPLEGDDDA